MASNGNKKVISEGYRLNGYDAQYEKATFLLKENGHVVSVADINTGLEFIIDIGDIFHLITPPTRSGKA